MISNWGGLLTFAFILFGACGVLTRTTQLEAGAETFEERLQRVIARNLHTCPRCRRTTVVAFIGDSGRIILDVEPTSSLPHLFELEPVGSGLHATALPSGSTRDGYARHPKTCNPSHGSSKPRRRR